MYTLERYSSFPSRKKTMFRFELNFTTCVRAYLPLPRHSCAEVTAAAPADGRPAAALAELRTCGSVARDGLWIRAIHTVVWQCRGAGCSAHLMAARWRPARACTHLDPIRVSSLSTVTSHQLLAARSAIPFARCHPRHLRPTTP